MGCGWEVVRLPRLSRGPLRTMAVGLRQGICVLPGDSVYLESAEHFTQVWWLMEGTAGQVGLGLGARGSADLHIQEVVHPSHDL